MAEILQAIGIRYNFISICGKKDLKIFKLHSTSEVKVNERQWNVYFAMLLKWLLVISRLGLILTVTLTIMHSLTVVKL
jgi:hypothetical protein